MASCVLVVNDGSPAASEAAETFRAEGWQVEQSPPGPGLLVPEKAELAILPVTDQGHGLDDLVVLRTRVGRRYVPVITLVPGSDPKPRLMAFAQGADDVLQAPFVAGELLARAHRCLALKQRIEPRPTAAELEAAEVDAATGLPNLEAFTHRLGDELRRAARYDAPVSVVLVELDEAQPARAQAGATPEVLIKQVARFARDFVRTTDFVCAVGSGALGLLLPHTPLPGALTVAERLAQGLRGLQVPSGALVQVSTSVGVASTTQRKGLSPEELLALAKEALGRARAESGNRIALGAVTS